MLCKTVWYGLVCKQSFTRRVLEDVGSEPMAHVELALIAACSARLLDQTFLLVRKKVRLRVVALRTQHELFYKPVQ